MIDWIILKDNASLDESIQSSFTSNVLIFKHSTTCSISLMVKMRLESGWDFPADVIKPYYLDLKEFRTISNEIAERLQVHHESPQVIVLSEGEVIYDASHFDITIDELKETLAHHARN